MKLCERRARKAADARPHAEYAVRLLGPEGMSSDEEAAPRSPIRYIHTHPWRSAEATTLIRTLDADLENDRRLAIVGSGRGNRHNVRLTHETRNQSGRVNACRVKKGMPENFYNWQVLEGREDYRRLNLTARGFLMPGRARPDLLSPTPPQNPNPGSS